MKRIKKELILEDFADIVPRVVLEMRFNKRELKHFDDYMVGQTIAVLHEQGGYYGCDIERFLAYRKKGLTGKKMPLDD